MHGAVRAVLDLGSDGSSGEMGILCVSLRSSRRKARFQSRFLQKNVPTVPVPVSAPKMILFCSSGSVLGLLMFQQVNGQAKHNSIISPMVRSTGAWYSPGQHARLE